MATAFRDEDKVKRGGRPSWDKNARHRDGHSARSPERRLRADRPSIPSSAPDASQALPETATRRPDEVAAARARR
jgi:hypothetical protein